MQIQAARLALAIVLVAGTLIVSLSPLNVVYAPAAWGVVALGAVLGLVICRWRVNHALRLTFHVSRFTLYNAETKSHLNSLDLAILSQTASATTQVLVAINLPSPHLPLHNTPGIGALYLLLAGVLAFIVVWLALSRGDKGRRWAVLLGAGLFSSTLYLRTFAVLEAGPVYGPVFALFLIAAFTFHVSRFTPHASRFTFWGLIFLSAVALSVPFSPVPAQSLDFWFKLAALMGLTVMLSLHIDTPTAWQVAAWGVVVIAGVFPITLACVKLFSLIAPFGLLPALSYRLHPTEFGGMNLIARSVLCVVPLTLALTKNAPKRSGRWIGRGTLVGSTLVILYARSWEGLFALLGTLCAYGLMVYWNDVKNLWQRLSDSGVSGWLLITGTVLLALILVTVLVYIAPLLNSYSVNGRLMTWHGAALAWVHHPWVGIGPANEYAYTPYSEQVDFLIDTQTTRDNPIYVVMATNQTLEYHSHNVLLEIGAGTGVLGFATFIGYLVALLGLGLCVLRRRHEPCYLWAASCLAGIMGALAWGMLDVLWVTPPFFSFPVWALIGLLVAAHRFPSSAFPLPRSSALPAAKAKPIVHCSLFIVHLSLAIVLVLLPALASTNYAAGFLALQEQRWGDAVSNLERAARYHPLDPRSRQLLVKAYLGQGDTERALVVYERVSALKQGYSPTYSQLGWLAWLHGDIDQATRYFQRAVGQDPGEIWRDGLHADLGLAYVANQRISESANQDVKEAIALFKETIELNPQMALAPYWMPVQRPDGRFDVVLDPVYLDGPSPELDKRILAHLGAADITERLFAWDGLAESPISLNDVLDGIYAEYQAAHASGSREAPLLLAALAEASRVAGLHNRAERAYVEFQALQPDSAYGFRDLGVLYHEQGRLAEAQAMLERAVAVSPRDVASRHSLALVYLDREMWDEAERALDVITRQSLVTLFHSRLFDPNLYVARARLYQAQGDLVQVINARRKAAIIREAPADYLALADLYRQLEQPQSATEQCLEAADALMRTWPRLLDPELWDIGLCLAQSDIDLESLPETSEVLGNVLLGHTHRAKGQWEQALTAYQSAAGARPSEGAPHYFLGETYQALGQPDLAEAEYRQAAQLDPLESLPLLALGRMQWERGREEAALESFRAAVEVTPGWGEAHTALGNALLASGDRDGAAEHYRLAQIADGDLCEGVLYDFAARLAEAEIQSPGADYVRNDYFTIDGDRRRVLFAHPDSRVSYRLSLPASPLVSGGTEGGLALAFDVATAPESWEQVGDGITFAIYVESGQGAQQLFSTYIDPKQDEAARRWHPYAIDLSAYTGQVVTLIFETNTGPAGDERYDWAGWGAPRVLGP